MKRKGGEGGHLLADRGIVEDGALALKGPARRLTPAGATGPTTGQKDGGHIQIHRTVSLQTIQGDPLHSLGDRCVWMGRGNVMLSFK